MKKIKELLKDKRIQLILLYAVLFLLVLDSAKEKQEACREGNWYITTNSENLNPAITKFLPKPKLSQETEILPLTARAACLMDAGSKRVLYEDNAETTMAMASTTKIMTLLVTLKNCDLSEIVTFSANAAKQPDVQLNAREGEQFVLGDLVYSLMLESHNDTAVAIAEHAGGSVEGFAAMMNAMAKEIGAEHTSFVTPNGLDAEGHYTTAYDLSLIACEALKNDAFVSIINTPSYQFDDLSHKRSYHVQNKNRFLYLMKGAIGIKTGFTNQAGYCFVGALKLDDRTLVSTVLGSGWPPHKEYKWSDTKKLMNYGINNFKPFFLFEKMEERMQHSLPTEIKIVNGENKTLPVALSVNLSNEKILMRDGEKIETGYEIYEFLTAPVKENTKVGQQYYYIDGKLLTSIPIITKQSTRKINYQYVLKELLRIY